MFTEADELEILAPEDLDAASDLYNDLVSGNHYTKQAEAEQWLRERSSTPEVRAMIERSISNPPYPTYFGFD